MYILYILTLLISISFLVVKYNKRSEYILEIIWIILFIAIGTYGYFSDDYEPYVDIVEGAYINPLAHFHIEPLWIWLSNICKGNINWFRLCSFAVLTVLILFTVRIYRVPIKYYLAYYTLLCMESHICWIRQPAAMITFLIGFGLIYKRKYIIGILCLIATIFLHKIGIVMILMLPFTLIKLNKRNLIIISCIIPIAFSIIKLILTFGDNLTIAIFNEYSDADGKFSQRHIIYTIINYIILITNISLIFIIISKYHKHTKNIYTCLVRYLFGVSFIIITLLIMPIQTDVMITRLFSIANMLLVIIMAKYVGNRITKASNKWEAIIILLIVCAREIGLIANNNTRIFRLTKPLF